MAAPETSRTDGSTVALWCGVIAFLVGCVAVAVSISPRDWEPSFLVRMTANEPMAEIARAEDPRFVFVADGHYDGVYAYAIAIDPVARGEAHERIDYAAYRYGRAGLGWMGWLFSAGRAAAVPAVLMVIGLISMAGAGFGASILAARLGWTPWGGLVVALNPGIIYGVTADTSEPLSAALMAAALIAWFAHRRVLGAIVMALLCMVKEPFLAVPAGLIVWELVRRRETGTASELWQRLGLLAIVPLPLFLWWFYLHGVFGEWPVAQSWLVEWPLVGWWDTARRAAAMSELPGEFQVGHASLPLLLGVGTAFIVGAVRAVRLRTPLDGIFLFFVAGASILSWYQLLYPKELLRILAIPLALVPAVFAAHGFRDREKVSPSSG